MGSDHRALPTGHGTITAQRIVYDNTLPVRGAGTVGGSGLAPERASAEELFDLLTARPAWWTEALCRKPPEGVSWFPARGEDQTDAKAICARCTARGECLAFALAEGIRDGLWGGLSPQERRRLRRKAS